jgi:broad specificity phosphatase PhoE
LGDVAVPHPLPRLFLARHGETLWSLSGQHTGRTDLALTANGEKDGLKLAQRLNAFQFAAIWTSPRQRAKHTAELAGYSNRLVVDPDLAEWDYGDYEGIDALGGSVHPVWTDRRAGGTVDGLEETYSATITVK